MPYKRKRDGKWIGQVIRKGEKSWSDPYATKTEAKDWESRQRNAAPAPPATACGRLADAYIDQCKLRFTARTVELKKQILKRLFDKDKPSSLPPAIVIDSITAEMALSYLSAVATERTGYVANTHRTHLTAWWNWCRKFHGVVIVCPFSMVDRFPIVKHNRVVPTMTDFEKLLDATTGQDHVLLLTYLHTAARRCELFEATWSDVDFGQNKIRLWTRKTRGQGRRADWLDMTDELAATLLDWRKQNPDQILVFHREGIAFTTRHTWLPWLCKKHGVPAFNFHGIRHLTATYLAGANVPLKTIQSILRHRHINITDAYIGDLRGQKEALKILPFGRKPIPEPTAKKTTKGDS